MPRLEKEFHPDDLIMWNGVNLEKYTASMDRACLPQIHQFLQLFEWDAKAERALEYLIRKYPAGQVVKSKRLKHKRTEEKPIEEEFQDQPELAFIVGTCPECDELVRGMGLPGCESELTGRQFYKECTVCTYYSEVFWDEDKRELKEIKGG